MKKEIKELLDSVKKEHPVAYFHIWDEAQKEKEKTQEMEDRFESIIFLENKVKTQSRELLALKNSLIESGASVMAKNNIIKSLEKTNERLLKTIEGSK